MRGGHADEEAATVLAPHSEARLNQTLRFLVGSGSDTLRVLCDESRPPLA